MDDSKNNWSDISDEVVDVTKKIKNKIEEEDLVEDLKESFNDTIENTSELIKNFVSTVDSTQQVFCWLRSDRNHHAQQFGYSFCCHCQTYRCTICILHNASPFPLQH